ncbi:MAG: DUF86 domain-containing protein [Candidatus Hydrogenedentota bacterium]
MNAETSILLRRIQLLSDYISELKELKEIKWITYSKERKTRRAVERLLQLIVEVGADISSEVLLLKNINPPETYYEVFQKLGTSRLISNKLAIRLAKTSGLRNRLVHEYGEYRDEIVFKNIKIFLNIYPRFISSIMKCFKLF